MDAAAALPRADDATLGRLTRDFAARAPQHDCDGSFPFENFEQLREARLPGLVIPSAYGGGGAGLAQAARVIGRIAWGDPATALVLSQHYLMHAAVARAGIWPEHLYARVATEGAREGALINALRVEPELGTPARGGLPATVARAVPGGWRISGRKIYSTGIPILRWLAVWARTHEADVRVGMFLVPRATPGVTVIPTWDTLGMRATRSDDVVLDDVLVPSDHAVDVRPPGPPLPEPMAAAWSAVLIGALYTGVATAARDWLVGHLNARAPSNLGAPLSTLPRVQEATGRIEALLGAGARLIRSAAEDTDAGWPPGGAESMTLRTTLAGDAIRAVEIALELTGLPGVSRANPLERHYRDVLCARIHTPQADTAWVAAGRAALAVGR